MAIDSRAKLAVALGNSAQIFPFDKASLSNTAAGFVSSLWRATGTPAQAAIPGAAAACDNTLLGSFNLQSPNEGSSLYLLEANLRASNTRSGWYLHDRLAHMGGLSGILTTSQTVGVDVSGAGSNMVARKGASDYSNVEWWIEIYTAIGTTATTATFTYTNAAGTAGRTTTVSIGGASPLNQPGRLFQIVGNGGEFIRSIQSVQLTATTGTAGSWGVTATRKKAAFSAKLSNQLIAHQWEKILTKVEDRSCLFFISSPNFTSTGSFSGIITVGQG